MSKNVIEDNLIRLISGMVLSILVLTPLVITSISTKASERSDETDELTPLSECK